MADGVTINTLTGSPVTATDDAGVAGHVQIVKLAISSDGSATVLPATAANGLLADVSRVQGTVTVAPSTAGDVAGTLTNGRKTITTAGAAEAIRATLACEWVVVTALKTNTSDVYVGGSGVVADAGSQTGVPLAAGEGVTIPVSDAAMVFIDVLTNGEGCTFLVGS